MNDETKSKAVEALHSSLEAIEVQTSSVSVKRANPLQLLDVVERLDDSKKPVFGFMGVIK